MLGESPALPAATTTTLPAAVAASTAALIGSVPSEGTLSPRLIEMTRTPGWAAHHWMPAITPSSGPEPPPSSTFAAYSAAPGATPTCAAAPADAEPVAESPSPAAIDVTWVPCPWSS